MVLERHAPIDDLVGAWAWVFRRRRSRTFFPLANPYAPRTRRTTFFREGAPVHSKPFPCRCAAVVKPT
jgi:hypothetical protein